MCTKISFFLIDKQDAEYVGVTNILGELKKCPKVI